MKKGGKVEMSNKQVVNVKVNVGDLPKKKAPKPRKARKQKVSGDTILLRAGNVPAPKRPGLHVRFLSPGSAFGGGLPGPLNLASYASAPPVAQPLGRMDFIGSGEGIHNRGRDRRDDIPINVNPSGIRADVNPSMRAVSSSGAVASSDMGLALSRSAVSSAGVQAMREAFKNMPQAIFQGEVPRLGGAELYPSMRAEPSQPASGWAEMSRYKPEQYVPPPASLAGASAVPSSASAMASISQPGRERMTSPQRRPQAERENYSSEFLFGSPKQKREPPVDYQHLRRGGSVF